MSRGGGERAWWGRSHRRQRLSAAPLPGCQPLGLAHAPDLQGHHAILATKALAADRAEAGRPMPTAAVPTCQAQGFRGIKTAVIAVRPRLALGKGRALEGPTGRCAE
jgi:hypothetical protein